MGQDEICQATAVKYWVHCPNISSFGIITDAEAGDRRQLCGLGDEIITIVDRVLEPGVVLSRD